MVYQRLRQPAIILIILLVIALLISASHKARTGFEARLDSASSDNDELSDLGTALPQEHVDSVDEEQAGSSDSSQPKYQDEILDPTETGTGYVQSEKYIDYREVFSINTWDRKFVPLFYQGANVVHPSIIPHPTEYYQWIVVSKRMEDLEHPDAREHVVCTAVFYQGTLLCVTGTSTLQLQPFLRDDCGGELSEQGLRPRAARTFYGPDAPYVLFESQSRNSCKSAFFIQDARQLIDDLYFESFLEPRTFLEATEIHPQNSSQVMEDNVFLFWDLEGRSYVHYELFPQRSFAHLEADGRVGEDLAPLTVTSDQMCYGRYMEDIRAEFEQVEQATNSLSITLCRREDSNCIPNENNTFIMHIFNVISFEDEHTYYRPYTVLLRQSPPFAIHAISQRPVWIHGQTMLEDDEGRSVQAESTYFASMNWMSHTQKYHGYVDDLLFLGFGFNGSKAHPGAMDLPAGDLLQDLAFC